PAGSGGQRGGGVAPELQQVVRGGDQAPFRAGGGSAAALEAVAAAVELDVGKDRFDHALALGVKTAAAIALKDAAHERVRAAVPARARALALAGVGRDEDLHAATDERVHLDVMPVAGVGKHDLGNRVDPDPGQLGVGGADHRFEVSEIGRVDRHV